MEWIGSAGVGQPLPIGPCGCSIKLREDSPGVQMRCIGNETGCRNRICAGSIYKIPDGDRCKLLCLPCCARGTHLSHRLFSLQQQDCVSHLPRKPYSVFSARRSTLAVFLAVFSFTYCTRATSRDMSPWLCISVSSPSLLFEAYMDPCLKGLGDPLLPPRRSVGRDLHPGYALLGLGAPRYTR